MGKNPVQKTKERVIMEHEVQMSLSIQAYGYKVKSIMAAYHNTDFSRFHPNETYILDHCVTNGYFGVNVHPYEIVFIKDNRDINRNLDINAVTRHHMSGFDSSKTVGKIIPEMIVAEVGGNVVEKVGEKSVGPMKVYAQKRSIQVPDGFDWERYLKLNPDICNSITTKEKAIYHWVYYGTREGRRW